MKEELLAALANEAGKSTSSVFDIAVMDEEGIASVRPTPSNYANDFYSVAKAFTAAGILVLFDMGKLTPDEKIYPILKEFFPDNYDKGWEDVTVAHCLNHRMGISGGFLDIDTEDQRTFGDDWLEYTFANIRLEYAPGEKSVYSDGAYYILSRIIEKVSGIEASAFIAKYITLPLEFRDHAWSKCPGNHAVGASGFYAAAEDAVKLAWLYVNGGRYGDKQIITERTIDLACKRNFGLSEIGDTNVFGKGGMCGQMLMADRTHRFAVAWHSFDRDKISDRLVGVVLGQRC